MALYGTAISLVQHPRTGQLGTTRDPDTYDATTPTATKKIAPFPSTYSELTLISLPVCNFQAPELPPGTSIPVSSTSDHCNYQQKEDWLYNVGHLLTKEKIGPEDCASWEAYRAKKSLSGQNSAIISL